MKEQQLDFNILSTTLKSTKWRRVAAVLMLDFRPRNCGLNPGLGSYFLSPRLTLRVFSCVCVWAKWYEQDSEELLTKDQQKNWQRMVLEGWLSLVVMLGCGVGEGSHLLILCRVVFLKCLKAAVVFVWWWRQDGGGGIVWWWRQDGGGGIVWWWRQDGGGGIVWWWCQDGGGGIVWWWRQDGGGGKTTNTMNTVKGWVSKKGVVFGGDIGGGGGGHLLMLWRVGFLQCSLKNEGLCWWMGWGVFTNTMKGRFSKMSQLWGGFEWWGGRVYENKVVLKSEVVSSWGHGLSRRVPLCCIDNYADDPMAA